MECGNRQYPQSFQKNCLHCVVKNQSFDHWFNLLVTFNMSSINAFDFGPVQKFVVW